MSVWMEIRCSRQSSIFCPSTKGDNVGQMRLSGDNKIVVEKSLSILSKQVMARGWKKVKNEGWVCPHCLMEGE